MPLTDFQREVLGQLAQAPASDRYLAGGAALHFSPTSLRYSDDLDFFHDSEARVAAAFAADRAQLQEAGFGVDVEFSQPGMVRAIVQRGSDATRVDWSHDSAWRFFPLVRNADGGWMLSAVDLAINKLLALAGRTEPRDLVDILYADREILPLGALVWAAPGKDPGFSPLSLLELLRRRGALQPEDLARLRLAQPVDVVEAKTQWRGALDDAERFVRGRTPTEVGCVYVNPATGAVVAPDDARTLAAQGLVPHFGAPGGVIPRLPDVGLRP